MAEHREQETTQQKHRIIFAEHCHRSHCASGGGPPDPSGLKRAQETISRQWPDREQHRVGVEALSVKLVGGEQHQQQQHNRPLVAPHKPARDQIDAPQRQRGIGHRQQLERPAGQRKNLGPQMRYPSHQWRMLGVTPGETSADRPGFQRVLM
jgi:hypothetical protein